MYLQFVKPAIAILLGSTLCFTSLFAADDEEAAEDVFYFLGTAISQNLSMFYLSEDELNQVVKGMRESLAGKAEQMDQGVYSQKLNELATSRMAANAEKEKALSQEYVEGMAAQEGAITTDSGLVYLELLAGKGVQPTAASAVTAHYHGTLRDGKVFDSSFQRGQPLRIKLTEVIPCWTEGIAMMKVGGRSRLTCPSDIAYGDRVSGMIPPGAALTFEVELIDVENSP
ncbi:MAG: FKBP-type peptidyl-prolyl cis-trans isomerase [Gammaproteobacteria bacterium]|nr:FKBP-type peptidyl-prolyl cis-trans isomerase [Gammaproteobacteria bacterium]MDP6616087.1 FKBP-type peptidyl-prolyl cis-trans isomerase [Gammaproteobacteria bacterium]MDP6695881.1 FKBP-type peptidyl-prolyl cis-trans isomerase [Gammaproteobacteria bacterium]